MCQLHVRKQTFQKGSDAIHHFSNSASPSKLEWCVIIPHYSLRCDSKHFPLVSGDYVAFLIDGCWVSPTAVSILLVAMSPELSPPGDSHVFLTILHCDVHHEKMTHQVAAGPKTDGDTWNGFELIPQQELKIR
jgi:hypothetical protein